MKHLSSWITFLMLFTYMLCTSSTCMATALMSPSAAALGGIRPGNNMTAVKRIYGMPNHRETSYDTDGDILEVWIYGDSFYIYFFRDTVVLLKTTANNGIKTPAGFTVGTRKETIYNAYGPPFVDQGSALWYRTSDGVDLVYMFENNRCSEIRCGYPL